MQLGELYLKAMQDDDFRERLFNNPDEVALEEDLNESQLEELKTSGLNQIVDQLENLGGVLLGAADAWCNNT